MSNIVPIDRTPSDVGMPLIPVSIAEAIDLANMMAKARLVPKDLQSSPSDCLMVVMQAKRWRMDPFAVAQECSVINGKLMHSGKLTAAVINTGAPLQRRLEYRYGGAGEGRYIDVVGMMIGENEPRVVRVELRNAKTANQQWVKQPDQQLAYHGARVWARRYVPELMLGVYSPEEFDRTPSGDYVTIENEAKGRLDEPTGEVIDGKDPSATYLDAARKVAREGRDAFNAYWKALPKDQRKALIENWAELEALVKAADQPIDSAPAVPEEVDAFGLRPVRDEGFWAQEDIEVHAPLDGATPREWADWEKRMLSLIAQARPNELEVLRSHNLIGRARCLAAADPRIVAAIDHAFAAAEKRV